MLRFVQSGSGARRDLVLCYHIASFNLLKEELWPQACCLADADGRYTRLGAAGTPRIDDAIAYARRMCGWFEPRSLSLIGFSAGCQAVREHLRAGVRPDVTVVLDGTSGEPQPREDQIRPWAELAARARKNECLAVMTYTQQTYVENLKPPNTPFAWTGRVINLATGVPLSPGGPVEMPAETIDGGLHVLSYASRSFDGAAHAAQQTKALPIILRKIVAPHLMQTHPTDPAPPPEMPTWQDPELSLGERCVLLSLEEYANNVREEPKGSNTGPRIREYFAPAYRLDTGKPLGMTSGNWCCVAACWAGRLASLPSEPVPHPYVASGIEMQRAAIQNGTWRAASTKYQPLRGDVVILQRGNPGSWERHVCRVETAPDAKGAYRTIDGNHGDAWGLVDRTLADADLLGFVEYPRKPAG